MDDKEEVEEENGVQLEHAGSSPGEGEGRGRRRRRRDPAEEVTRSKSQPARGVLMRERGER